MATTINKIDMLEFDNLSALTLKAEGLSFDSPASELAYMVTKHAELKALEEAVAAARQNVREVIGRLVRDNPELSPFTLNGRQRVYWRSEHLVPSCDWRAMAELVHRYDKYARLRKFYSDRPVARTLVIV